MDLHARQSTNLNVRKPPKAAALRPDALRGRHCRGEQRVVSAAPHRSKGGSLGVRVGRGPRQQKPQMSATNVFLFFKVLSRADFGCLTSGTLRVRPPLRSAGAVLCANISSAAGDKNFRNPKSPVSKFSAANPLKSPKTTKEKFGKACRKPAKICKKFEKFGKNLQPEAVVYD